MDVRLWGPSGWKLLHTIAHHYKATPEAKENAEVFFCNLKHILPCIYCRESLTGFIDDLPIAPYLGSSRQLQQWVYKIHNKVNAKLRKQGENSKPDPKFGDVIKQYDAASKSLCRDMPGWDFLFSIAFNYPNKPGEITEDKRTQHIIFFEKLIELLPDCDYKEKFASFVGKNPVFPALKNRGALKRWMYRLYKFVHCQSNTSPSFNKVCDRYEFFRAGCAKKGFRGRTCRKSLASLKMTKKQAMRLIAI
jgi:hypothetical protein